MASLAHEGAPQAPQLGRPTLYVFTAIAFSPWSEKARWALDHHGVDYREADYTPILGEIALRWRLRRPLAPVTVPVLTDGKRWWTDSFDIARHAESIGQGDPLFPGADQAEIEEWNRRSEMALAAGRAILMRSWVDTPELVRAALPPGLPRILEPLFRPIGRKRLASFVARYRIPETMGTPDDLLAAELDTLASALEGRRYLVGDTFSYADITMALTLQQVSPVDPAYIVRLAGLPESGMHIEAFASRYGALIAWRDALYARHRRPSDT